MRVVIFGGRNFGNLYNKDKTSEENLTEYRWIMKCLDDYLKLNPNLHIITGMATGVDLVAYDFAIQHELGVSKFPANWNRYGRSAGTKRNKQMIVDGKPDVGLAFPGGPGTRNMKQQLNKAGIKILEFKYVNNDEVYQF